MATCFLFTRSPLTRRDPEDTIRRVRAEAAKGRGKQLINQIRVELEQLRQIRAQPRWKQLPIIAVTAKAMKNGREKCLQAGASDYCPKPADVDQLLRQTQKLLA